MIKIPFFGTTPPSFQHQVLPQDLPRIVDIEDSGVISLLAEIPFTRTSLLKTSPGMTVKKGQKLKIYAHLDAYVISPVSGKVKNLCAFQGDYGRECTRIDIQVQDDAEASNEFMAVAASLTLKTAMDYLLGLPGAPPFQRLANKEKPIDTLVINGIDTDLGVMTQQQVVAQRGDDLKAGIAVLKRMVEGLSIVLVVPRDRMQTFGHIGVELKAVDVAYPAGLSQAIMYQVLGRNLAAGESPESAGVAFFSAESVASLGKAYTEKELPFRKSLTLIDKDNQPHMVSTAIGTPIGQIFNGLGITLSEQDQIVFGGPMRGVSVYATDIPVQADTDAVMVQAANDVAYYSDYPCVNCGECIRICPAKIAVNMLVRFLEAGAYQEAADEYDLFSCFECGLCSVVCIAKIPIYQYIRLAKHDLGLAVMEAANE